MQTRPLLRILCTTLARPADHRPQEVMQRVLKPKPPMADHTFKELTHQRVFMRMWFAKLFGTTGNQMLMVAVGWQMYELTSMS